MGLQFTDNVPDANQDQAKQGRQFYERAQEATATLLMK